MAMAFSEITARFPFGRVLGIAAALVAGTAHCPVPSAPARRFRSSTSASRTASQRARCRSEVADTMMGEAVRQLIRIALWASFLLPQAQVAGAQTNAATAEMLMRQSGLWNQLAGVAPQVRGGLMASLAQAGVSPSASEVERLSLAVDSAYAAGRLRKVALASIQQGIDVKHVPSLRHWYGTAAGKAVTALEEAAATDQREPEIIMKEGAALLNEASAERRALLAELVAVTRSAESMVQLLIDTSLAAVRGARSAAPNVPGPSPTELRAMLDAQKPRMLKAYEGLALASSAKVYATLSTETLGQYVVFLKSDAGRHFNDVGMRALGAAMVDASTELGRRLPASKDQANT
jgi:hypothetical protein